MARRTLRTCDECGKIESPGDDFRRWVSVLHGFRGGESCFSFGGTRKQYEDPTTCRPETDLDFCCLACMSKYLAGKTGQEMMSRPLRPFRH